MDQDRFFKSYNPKRCVSNDFESRVLDKINIRKIRKKRMTYFASFGVLVLVAYILIQLIPMNSSSSPSFKADRFNRIPKEEVPVIEDVYFVSSDSTTSYTLERVPKRDFDQEI